jgi:hypothetical protein
VDDEEDGDWTDNTGNLAYVLKSLTVPDDSPMPGWIDVMPGCDTPPLTPGALDAGDIFSAEVISNLGNYIAGWFDYLTASVVRFFAWCPEHTAYMMTMGDGIKLREPFATLDEMDRQLNDIKNEISGYGFDYDGTDYSILNKSPSESVSMINEYMFGELPEDSPWIDGDLVSFEANPDVEFTDECGLALTDYIGPRLSQGVCFSTDWAREVGMLFWVQLLLDAGVFFACIASVVGNLRKLIYLFTGVNFGTQSGDAKVFVTNVMSEDSPWKGRR